MAAPTATRSCGTVPSNSFKPATEADLLVRTVTFAPERREQRFTESGQIKGAQWDQPAMTVSFSALITGTGTESTSAVTKGLATEVTTAFANFTDGTPVHEHDAADGCVVFLNVRRVHGEDEATLDFDLLHLPHAV